MTPLPYEKLLEFVLLTKSLPSLFLPAPSCLYLQDLWPLCKLSSFDLLKINVSEWPRLVGQIPNSQMAQVRETFHAREGLSPFTPKSPEGLPGTPGLPSICATQQSTSKLAMTATRMET